MNQEAAKWGFGNDVARHDAANQYRDAAVQDGWSMTPMYDKEPVESAARLTRDGFIMQVFTRQHPNKRYRYETSISIWGPDRLAIKPPTLYSWEEIQRGLRTCCYCEATDVDVERVGFAGRSCAHCYVKLKAKLEFPGWTG